MTRNVVYVSGTRADFGLMHRALQAIDNHSDLDLSLAITGMHLNPAYGETVREIEASGFAIRDRVETPVTGGAAAEMGLAIGQATAALSASFAATPPDLVLLLGDRGEMLAGAIAGLHAGAAVVHIHGGERSGTIDEPVRHAISKLSHYHLTATEDAAARLRRMGEPDWRIRVIGAPGLDDLSGRPEPDRTALCRSVGFDPAQPVVLTLFHPVVQQAAEAEAQMTALLRSLEGAGLQILLLDPNADAGGQGIGRAIDAFTGSAHVPLHRATHLERAAYLDWLATADLIAGNSSSGIIESASLGTPCLNVGDRQRARIRNANIVDVPEIDASSLAMGIRKALALGSGPWTNLWGDGETAPRIASFLAEASLDAAVFDKLNAD